MTHSQIQFRFATPQDIPQILTYIKGLAEYEKMSDQVVATEELLQEWLFNKKKAEVLLAEYQGNPAGFALFFHNFSTFLAGPASIWRTCMCCRNTGEKAWGKGC